MHAHTVYTTDAVVTVDVAFGSEIRNLSQDSSIFFYLWVKSSTPTFLWPAWRIICAERLPRQHSFLKRNKLFKLPPPSPLWLVPCSDHHQVVQEARAHFLFLHLGLRTSCASAHLGSMLPVESVLHSKNSRRDSGGKLRLLAVHRCGWKKTKPGIKTEKK